ncbi:MAG: heavy metal translocating P-type ATPase [Geovibrio sp.]|nr:heavy metal translocating P-type ATPase [Geovibrio sp.]
MEYVWVVRGQSEEKTAVSDLQIGDMVRAGSGEMIPVDGKVASGEGLVNQASVTGESLPVHIKPGDYVYSGTVMAEGKIIIEAEKVGSETTTARIAKFISNSLKNKSRTEVKAFAAADKMVPVTFAAGLATLLITRDFRRASSVLSVDYSCALQLVTPTAIKASMFNAATEGIFIKGAQALENLAEIDTIIFDKTGTLTKGMLSVTEVQPYNGYNENEIVRIAASAEEYYSHPIASAVVKEAENRGLKTEQTGEVDFIIAHGVSAYVGGKNVLVGSHHFVAEDEKIVCCFADEDARKMRTKGQTILYVAIDGKLCGLIALKDTLRDESAQVIKELKKHGVKKTVMLTGDHRDSALHVAELLGIDEVYYEMKPEDKAGIVKQLKNQGCRIAFAGDGVNDAPALLTADVGISLPQGADLAKETAAVILLREDLMGIVKARVLAVKTMKVIRQMFRFNIGVNTATVALSLMGRISPLASALLHNGTTLSTLIYALSLSSYGVKRKKEK